MPHLPLGYISFNQSNLLIIKFLYNVKLYGFTISNLVNKLARKVILLVWFTSKVMGLEMMQKESEQFVTLCGIRDSIAWFY